MSKKKRAKKNKEKKIIIPYTKEERSKQINEIRTKLHTLGLAYYNDEMKSLQKKMDEFIESGNEYSNIIKLYGAKRILEVSLRNNNKKPIRFFLKYNENI